MKYSFLSLLSFLFLIGSAYSQHKYYFSNGQGEGNGTRQQPFTSLQKLSELALGPGDTVFFRAGDTISGNVSLSNIHGIKEHNIFFTSYGKGRSRINGGNREAFVITISNYFQIVNLSLLGSGRKHGNTTDGLKVVNCKNFGIKNLDVSGFQKAGAIFYNCEAAEVNGVVAHDNGLAGILVEGDYKKRISNNIRIFHCRADNNPGDPTNLDNHSGNGILVGNCKNVLIEYCTATNNGWDMPRIGNGPVGIWAYEADSVTIQHCIAFRNKTARGAADGGGFDLDGGVTNSIIQYCLSFENWGSGYGIFEYNGADKWYNNTVRYCISINDGFVTDQASAMLIWNGWNSDSIFTDFYAYNNFFYNDKKYAFGFSDQSHHKKFSFFNNVFVSADTSDIFNGIDSSSSDLFFGNVWIKKNGGFAQNGFTDLAQWANSTGYEQEKGKLTGTSFTRKLVSIPSHINIADPYLLKTNSTLLSLCNNILRNRGIDIRKMFSIGIGKTDFFGHAIPSHGNFSSGLCQKD